MLAGKRLASCCTQHSLLLKYLCNTKKIKRNFTYEVLRKSFGYGEDKNEILQNLGFKRIITIGFNENDISIGNYCVAWHNRFWSAVNHILGNKDGGGKEVNIRNYSLLEQPKEGDDTSLHPAPNQKPSFDENNPFLAPIIVNRELYKGGGRSCMHIELDINGSHMHYDAGDHIAMYPINDDELVEKLGKLCNIDLDTTFHSYKNQLFTGPITYRTALTYYLEISALPCTHILEHLADYCSNETDKHFLRSIASKTTEGQEKYQSWIKDACRNVVHILEDIKSCRPSIDHLCELLPSLKPRYYSVSSSSKLHPQNVHVTAVLVEYTTPTGRVNKGVATAYLKRKQTKGCRLRVPVFISKSQFRLPVQSEIPIIMVGTGTGLAPFRGFIQERQFMRDEGKSVGETILYFGCRRKNEDFIYQEELEEYVNNGILELRTAFSRDQVEKVYVTDLLEKDADLIWKVIGENGGHFYICGDAKNMAVDVKNVLVKILTTKGNMNKVSALQYLKEMEEKKRYSADVWS